MNVRVSIFEMISSGARAFYMRIKWIHNLGAGPSFDDDGSHENVTIGTSGDGYRDLPSRRLN